MSSEASTNFLYTSKLGSDPCPARDEMVIKMCRLHDLDYVYHNAFGCITTFWNN